MYPELIKLMVMDNNMSHKKLGQIMGVSQQAASKKLKGEYDFKCNEMKKIKDYFKQKYPDITMDQIFTKEFFYLQGAQNEPKRNGKQEAQASRKEDANHEYIRSKKSIFAGSSE